jgi:hypothetical protein
MDARDGTEKTIFLPLIAIALAVWILSTCGVSIFTADSAHNAARLP